MYTGFTTIIVTNLYWGMTAVQKLIKASEYNKVHCHSIWHLYGHTRSIIGFHWCCTTERTIIPSWNHNYRWKDTTYVSIETSMLTIILGRKPFHRHPSHKHIFCRSWCECKKSDMIWLIWINVWKCVNNRAVHLQISSASYANYI